MSFKFKKPRKAPSSKDQGHFFKKSPVADQSFFGNTSNQPIQPKLTVGKPGDKYEQEADAVADQVVSNQGGEAVQRMGMEEEEAQPKLQKMEEEEEAQAKLQMQEEEEEMQPKLQKMEEEEEAAQPKLQMMEEEEAQAKLQMQEEEEEMAQPKLQMQEEEELQTKANPSGGSPANLSSRLNSQKGKGQPLPPKTNQEMSTAIGRDFSDVSIHNDQESVSMNQELGAQAFTHGKDVFFNEGKFNPESTTGKHLLAHELTHVVQQNGKKKSEKK